MNKIRNLVVALVAAGALVVGNSASAQAWGQQKCYSPQANFTFFYGYGPLAAPGMGCYFFLNGWRYDGYVVW